MITADTLNIYGPTDTNTVVVGKMLQWLPVGIEMNRFVKNVTSVSQTKLWR